LDERVQEQMATEVIGGLYSSRREAGSRIGKIKKDEREERRDYSSTLKR
jgi:hypothetical protein